MIVDLNECLVNLFSVVFFNQGESFVLFQTKSMARSIRASSTKTFVFVTNGATLSLLNTLASTLESTGYVDHSFLMRGE